MSKKRYDNMYAVLKKNIKICGLVLLLCLILVIGCAVGPNFKPIEATLPSTWAGPAPKSDTGTEKEIAGWWAAFNDPILVSLVKRATDSNLDVKQAEARIRQARAARGVSISGFGPVINAVSSYRRSHSPQSTAGSDGITSNQYQAGFDAAWELDIFGGVRRSVEAADADLQAAVEGRRDVLVTLAAEVAVNYIDLRAYQQRLIIARNNLAAQNHTAELTHKRVSAGFASSLDAANADAQAATTAAQIPLLEASTEQAIYSLSLLIGREPAALLTELRDLSEIPAASPSVPVGVPSDLLRRRPDIRRAEAQIHAATARIGVATADLFPKFSISGSVGFQNDEFNSWMDRVNRFWSFGPSVSWQIFNTGKTISNIELQKALQEQSAITYKQTILTALQEVDNSLIASAKEEERKKAFSDAVTANKKAVDLAKQLYIHGQTDFLNVLLAQRSFYASEDALAQSTRTVSTNLVALYKALGGGWETTIVE
ncbi:MAG: efflux transporter outer membrane subunit [Desulfobacterium sp.]|nr:efflux transporter outer membrane subunit [Desulfobacterium sp.]MBU3949087.1 efflux transporter outer membrane subunit [Pseudomonadota bacterium]MBU4037197.1 efflux transporter outer membrane subunit [Pseudomonadota bacterium]